MFLKHFGGRNRFLRRIDVLLEGGDLGVGGHDFNRGECAF